MLHWYVVHSKPRKEEWLFNQFTALQINAYYPCYREHGTLYLHKSRPYFPGYLFINVDIESLGTSAVQWIPGSLGLVTFGGEPASVPDELLQRIRHHVEEINAVGDKVRESLRPGDEIAIHSGPFAGYSGVFNSYISDRERVAVLLRFIRDQQVRVELPVRQITLRKQLRTKL